MLKSIYFFILSAVMLAACETPAQDSPPTFTIEGTLTGAPTPLPIYLRDLFTEENVDSVLMLDSTFTFTGPAPTPRQYRLVYDGPLVSHSHDVWVTDTLITVQAHWDDMYNRTIAAGQDQAYAEEVKEALAEWEKSHELVYDPFVSDLNEENLDLLFEMHEREQQEYWLPLVLDRVDSYYAAWGLFNRRDLIETETLQDAYDQMRPEVQQSAYGQALHQHITQDSLQPGDPFVDYPVTNLEGEQTQLSDYIGNGKPTLLVFGALGRIWQVQRDLIGQMQYAHGEEVNVLGFTFEHDLQHFQQDTAWYHGVPLITDFKKELSPVAIRYGATHLPTVYVFGPDGTIRYRSDQYTEEAHEMALSLVE